MLGAHSRCTHTHSRTGNVFDATSSTPWGMRSLRLAAGSTAGQGGGAPGSRSVAMLPRHVHRRTSPDTAVVPPTRADGSPTRVRATRSPASSPSPVGGPGRWSPARPSRLGRGYATAAAGGVLGVGWNGMGMLGVHSTSNVAPPPANVGRNDSGSPPMDPRSMAFAIPEERGTDDAT